MPTLLADDPRQLEAEPEYDPEQGMNVVSFLAEVFPGDVESLTEMFREAHDLEDVFLVWKMTPTKAREIAHKLLAIADVCEKIDRPIARKTDSIPS